MKRIISYVLPVESRDTAEATWAIGTAESGTAAAPPPDLSSAIPGAMRVEVIVSDEQASRILNELFEQGTGAGSAGEPENGSPTHDAWESFIRRELQAAEPDARDLLDRFVQQVEKEVITQVYTSCDNVKYRAAAKLGINRNTLVKRLRQFGQVIEVLPEEEDSPQKPR
jgi:DNA-binding protein Fis